MKNLTCFWQLSISIFLYFTFTLTNLQRYYTVCDKNIYDFHRSVVTVRNVSDHQKISGKRLGLIFKMTWCVHQMYFIKYWKLIKKRKSTECCLLKKLKIYHNLQNLIEDTIWNKLSRILARIYKYRWCEQMKKTSYSTKSSKIDKPKR